MYLVSPKMSAVAADHRTAAALGSPDFPALPHGRRLGHQGLTSSSVSLTQPEPLRPTKR